MTPREKYSPDLENLEIELLLQAIHRLQGVDLSEQPGPPVRRRIWEAIKRERTRTVSGLQEKLLHDSEALLRFLKTVVAPALPYSPEFLARFRTDLIPIFRTYPFIRIWQIGCDSVFETYSLAIALLEEGVYDRCVIYSTDVNEAAIQQCYDGIFPLSQLPKYENIYEKSGGRGTLDRYFSGGGESGMFDLFLRRNMVFARHNLATDSSFNECNAVFCRFALKFLERSSQERAHQVIYDSLVQFGILGLSRGESLESSPARPYSEFDSELGLYRKAA